MRLIDADGLWMDIIRSMDYCDDILEFIERQPTITTNKEKDMSEEKWITIDFKNGENCHYTPDEYTDYRYDGKYFVVIFEKQWIGFYNLDEVRYIEIGSIEDAERGNRE